MKLFLLAAVLLVSTASARASDVGVSVTIGEPGFYGRIDIGDYPTPQLLYRQPRYIQRRAAGRSPIYMHVPPGHAKNWRKHCAAYGACDERVYFVGDRWYQREYVQRYQARQAERRDGRNNGQRDDRRGNDHGDRQRGGNDRGPNR